MPRLLGQDQFGVDAVLPTDDVTPLGDEPLQGGGNQGQGGGLYRDHDHIRRVVGKIIDTGGDPGHLGLQGVGPLDDDAGIQGRLEERRYDIAEGDLVPPVGQEGGTMTHPTGPAPMTANFLGWKLIAYSSPGRQR